MRSYYFIINMLRFHLCHMSLVLDIFKFYCAISLTPWNPEIKPILYAFSREHFNKEQKIYSETVVSFKRISYLCGTK